MIAIRGWLMTYLRDYINDIMFKGNKNSFLLLGHYNVDQFKKIIQSFLNISLTTMTIFFIFLIFSEILGFIHVAEICSVFISFILKIFLFGFAVIFGLLGVDWINSQIENGTALDEHIKRHYMISKLIVIVGSILIGITILAGNDYAYGFLFVLAVIVILVWLFRDHLEDIRAYIIFQFRGIRNISRKGLKVQIKNLGAYESEIIKNGRTVTIQTRELLIYLSKDK